MSIQPRTDNEWTIHAVNIQGTFFERLCKKIIAETPGWTIKATNHPVEYPPPNGPWRGKESKLDILAQCHKEDAKLTLLIECKKNNPELTNWIFFPVVEKAASEASFAYITATVLDNIAELEPGKSWQIQTSIRTLHSGFKVANDGIETKGSYLEYIQKNKDHSKLTKTAKNSIEDAAYQVALAARSVLNEETVYSETLKNYAARRQDNVQIMPYKRQLFLPVIVTTAELFLCHFDPADIDIARGELPLDKAHIYPYPYLLYQYALPRSLQHAPNDLAEALLGNQLGMFSHMDILLVNSKALSTILSLFADRMPTLIYT
jgi:hypothetical protein